MYAGSVGWPAPASMSADWSPLSVDDTGANLWVSVGDALVDSPDIPCNRHDQVYGSSLVRLNYIKALILLYTIY
jgi:hypothetical protein